MTLKQALAILAANDAGKEGSFIYELHERDNFDRPSLWMLITAMAIIAAQRPDERHAQTREQAFHIYDYVLSRLIQHGSPQGGSGLRRVPGRNLHDYLERFRWVFAPVIRGVPGYGWPADFGDGLKNPHEAVLVRHFRRRRES
jgi:hypothetical protein